MADEVTNGATATSRSTRLALASIAVWLAAAALARPLGIWLAIGGAAVALGVAILLLDRPAAIALLRPSPRLVFLGATVGSLMAAATHALYPALARTLPFIETDTARLYVAFRSLAPAVASIALVPVVVGEELVWRGVLQAWLVQRLGAWRGIVLAAVVYALVHAPLGSPLLVAVAFLCALVWGTLRATTASLVPPLVTHLLWDVIVLLWLPLDAR